MSKSLSTSFLSVSQFYFKQYTHAIFNVFKSKRVFTFKLPFPESFLCIYEFTLKT